jgi:histidinol-phosphate aminotransferase
MVFLKNQIVEIGNRLMNYADREVASVDLSLVTGPCVWNLRPEALFEDALENVLATYPNPPEDGTFLAELAHFEDIPADHLLLTPGADIGIELVCRQFIDVGDSVGLVVPTFPRFEIVLQTLSAKIAEYTNISLIDSEHRLCCLCTPNNPTTGQLDPDKLESLFKKYPRTVFLIDSVFERYGDYRTVDFVKRYKNVIVLKSFSKIGLAGLRLGYVVANPEIIKYLRIGQSPFSVPLIVQKIGLQILRQKDKLSILDEEIERSYSYIKSKLGSSVIRESRVPFYLLHTNQHSRISESILMDNGISVVGAYKFKNLPANYLRVALGNDEQNIELVNCVQKNRLV